MGIGQGVIPFVVAVDDADIMALLVKVKYEVEDLRGSTMRMVFFGGAEAHLIAEEIGALGKPLQSGR